MNSPTTSGLLGILLFLVVTGMIGEGLNPPIHAQIIPDKTLGRESSVVKRDRIKGLDSDRIDGGAVRANSLFHSFSGFHVKEQRGAYFTNPNGVNNIFVRVTGKSPSDILGRLGVLGNANLLFLNPNGIVFGPKASLDIAGSLLATTADSFLFDEGKIFSAVNPDAPPLLTVNLTPGLQYGASRSSSIINAGNLAVGANKNLTLTGNSVINTGTLRASGGEVAIASISQPSSLQLSDNGKLLHSVASTDAPLSGRSESLQISPGDTIISGVIDVANLEPEGTGGQVKLLGDRIALLDSAQIIASGANGGGTIKLEINGDAIIDDALLKLSSPRGNVIEQISDAQGSEPLIIAASKLKDLAGDGNVILEATNNITINDLADNTLAFQAGTGTIAFTADSDGDGVGAFSMLDVADAIQTNGRSIEISAASLAVGKILTTLDIPLVQVGGGNITLTSTNGDITADMLDASSLNDKGGNIAITAHGGDVRLIDSQILSLSAIPLGAFLRLPLIFIIVNEFPLTVPTGTATGGVLLLDRAEFDTGNTLGGRTGGVNLYADVNITIKDSNLTPTTGCCATFNIGFLTSPLNRGIQRLITIPGINNPSGILMLAATIRDDRDIIVPQTIDIIGSTIASNNSPDIGIAAAIVINANDRISIIDSTLSVSGDNASFGGGINIGTGFASNSSGIPQQVDIQDSEILARGGSDSKPDNAGFIFIAAHDSIALNNSAISSNGDRGVISLGVAQDFESDPLGVTQITDHITIQGSEITSVSRNDAGRIALSANDSITLIDDSRVSTNGNQGVIDIGTGMTPGLMFGSVSNQVDIRDSQVTSSSAEANAGQIAIQSQTSLVVDQGFISSSTQTGTAGNITVSADNRVELSGIVSNRLDDDAIGGILAEATNGGNAGRVSLTTPQLAVSDGAQIAVSSNGSEGIAGNVTLTGIEQLTVLNGSQITASTQTGIAGNVSVNDVENPAKRILVSGNNSRIAVEATGAEGTTPPTINQGTAGDLSLFTQQLIVNDGEITVSSETGRAGNLTIGANSILLDRGIVSSETARSSDSERSAEITLELGAYPLLFDGNPFENALFLRKNSLISAKANGNAEGGNVTISSSETINSFLLAQPLSNSDIIATASEARGGEINISFDQFFGLTLREAPSDLDLNSSNDISASSAEGPQGIINLNGVIIDPSKGINELTIPPIDSPPLNAVCNTTVKGSSEFSVIGRGGLPTAPIAPPNSLVPWEDWYITEASSSPLNASHASTLQHSPDRHPIHSPSPASLTGEPKIIEAQGWGRTDQGHIQLVTTPVISSPTHEASPHNCRT